MNCLASRSVSCISREHGGRMGTVRTALAAVAAQVALLGVLAATVGVSGLGLTVGLLTRSRRTWRSPAPCAPPARGHLDQRIW